VHQQAALGLQILYYGIIFERYFTMNELEKFIELVKVKAAEKSADILPNAGADHASVAMSALFENTRHSANLLLGSLDGNVSDQPNYIESLKNFLSRDGIELNILFIHDPNPRSKTYLLLQEYKREGKNIRFKQLNEAAGAILLNRLDNKGNEFHYSVFDKTMFRYEKDIHNYLAWFSFNDSSTSIMLDDLFQEAFEKAGEIT